MEPMKKTYLLSVALVLIGLNSFANWSRQVPLPQGDILGAVYFTDANTGYLLDENGIILKTDNAGVTWTAIMKMDTPVLSPTSRSLVNTDYSLLTDRTFLQTSDDKPIWFSWLKKLEMKIALFIYLF